MMNGHHYLPVERFAVGYTTAVNRKRKRRRYVGVMQLTIKEGETMEFIFAPCPTKQDALQHLADILEASLMKVRYEIIALRP